MVREIVYFIYTGHVVQQKTRIEKQTMVGFMVVKR